jgi:hypothetical protein
MRRNVMLQCHMLARSAPQPNTRIEEHTAAAFAARIQADPRTPLGNERTATFPQQQH